MVETLTSRPPRTSSGYPIAKAVEEASSRAIYDLPEENSARPVRKSGCEVHDRLLCELGGAVRELLTLHEQQLQAIMEGDSESSRFDLLIHMANENKYRAKYAYLRHMESHGCSNVNANQT
jgi:hypothetical protein